MANETRKLERPAQATYQSPQQQSAGTRGRRACPCGEENTQVLRAGPRLEGAWLRRASTQMVSEIPFPGASGPSSRPGPACAGAYLIQLVLDPSPEASPHSRFPESRNSHPGGYRGLSLGDKETPHLNSTYLCKTLISHTPESQGVSSTHPVPIFY